MPVAADPVAIAAADRRGRRIIDAGRTEPTAARKGQPQMAGLGRAPARVLRRALSQRPLGALLPDAGAVRGPHARRHQGGEDASACGRISFGAPARDRTASRCLSLAVATFAFLVSAAPLSAQEDDLKRGEALLQTNCARCHAIGRTGTSPNKDAPAFRTLGQRYPIESLEEALGEGIVSGHPDMPEMSFDADDVGAIIAYLNSIQQR